MLTNETKQVFWRQNLQDKIDAAQKPRLNKTLCGFVLDLLDDHELIKVFDNPHDPGVVIRYKTQLFSVSFHVVDVVEAHFFDANQNHVGSSMWMPGEDFKWEIQYD